MRIRPVEVSSAKPNPKINSISVAYTQNLPDENSLMGLEGFISGTYILLSQLSKLTLPQRKLRRRIYTPS